MNENIDLTKILDGCPKGTEFYSLVHGKLKYLSMYVSSSASQIMFEEVNSRSIIDGTPLTVCYYRDGRMYPLLNGECVVFPSKTQRDWAKFVRFWDKPKIKKFDPKTFQVFDEVLVRIGTNYDSGEWHIDFFEYFDEKNKMIFNLSSLPNNWVIPYNNETKHLVNTTDDCAEYYKWWEE